MCGFGNTFSIDALPLYYICDTIYFRLGVLHEDSYSCSKTEWQIPNVNWETTAGKIVEKDGMTYLVILNQKRNQGVNLTLKIGKLTGGFAFASARLNLPSLECLRPE